MAFLTIGKDPKGAKQRLYLMEITLPSGMKVVKCGKASGESSKARMLQICASIYDKFRTTPMIKIKRDKEVPTDLVFKYETNVHRFFKDYHYHTKTKFDGSGECFTVPVDDMVAAYEAVIEGNEPDFTYVMPEVGEDNVPF